MPLPKLTETYEQALERATREAADYPILSRAPSNNGELPGYRPASHAIVEQSREQAKRVRTTRSRERKAAVQKVATYGAVILTAVGVTAGVVKLGDRYVAHEQAPWGHSPAASHQK